MTIILSRHDLSEPKRPRIGGKPRTCAFRQNVRDLLNDATNVWFQADDMMYCLKSRFGPLDDVHPASAITLAQITAGKPA